MRRVRVRGFTLLEVLVSLAVLAIALSALLGALLQAIDLSAALRERAMAVWVAEELWGRQAEGSGPASVDSVFAWGGRDWSCRVRSVPSGTGPLAVLTVEVRSGREAPVLASLSGLVWRGP